MNHTRKVKKTYLAINKVLKNRVKRNNPALVKAKEELVEVVDDVMTTAKKVLGELDIMENKDPRIRGLAKQLDGWLEATGKVVEQTRKVLKGRVHLKDRLVAFSILGLTRSRKENSEPLPNLDASC